MCPNASLGFTTEVKKRNSLAEAKMAISCIIIFALYIDLRPFSLDICCCFKIHALLHQARYIACKHNNYYVYSLSAERTNMHVCQLHNKVAVYT